MELIALQFDLDGPLGVVLAVSRVVIDAAADPVDREMLAATVRQGTVGTMSRRRRHDCRPGRTTP